MLAAALDPVFVYIAVHCCVSDRAILDQTERQQAARKAHTQDTVQPAVTYAEQYEEACATLRKKKKNPNSNLA